MGVRFSLAKTDPFAASPAFEVGSLILETPTLLHIGHPYALANLHTILTHIKSLRLFVGQLSARGENAQIARDVLVELIDCSGFDIDALCVLLAECIQDANNIPGPPSLLHMTLDSGLTSTLANDALRSLALCQPTSAMSVSLRKSIQKLTDSSVIDKPRLFLKSSDLVDGISRMSLVERPSKEKRRDIISKALLAQRGATLVCIRCGGQSDVGGDTNVAGHVSLRWRAWERVWTVRCTCGGTWIH
jgi:hypothetical protein